MANTQTFTGDGTTTSFYFTFPFFGVNDIKVSVGGVAQTSDDITIYPSATSGDAPDVPYTGGRIDFATAPASGAIIKAWRNIEITRHIDYQPTAQPKSHQLNQDLNQCIEILKEQSDKLSVLDDIDMDLIENVETTVTGHLADTNNPHSVTIAQIGALSSSTKYGASLVMSMDSSTYVVTVQLKDQDGNTLGTAQTIDLPMESVVVSGSYDSDNKKVVLTLKSGSTVEFSVADLISGLQTTIDTNNKLSADLVSDSSTTNKFVTASDITNWNGKANSADLATVATTGTLASLTDATISTPSNGQVLMYDDGAWKNTTATASVAWGGITGTLSSQTDLQNALDAKQGTLTAGTNITISSGTISATDTTYSAMTGADGTNAGTSGLVPAPAATDNTKFLRGDGTWATAGGGTSLPSQSGNSGKFLTTDGTDASWGTVATVATTGAYSDLTGTPTIPSTATDVNAIPQLTTLPTAAAGNEGQIVQFVGTTDANYTNGYFYKSTENGGTYSWVQTDVQPAGGGSSLPDQTGKSGMFLTTDGTNASWGKALTNISTNSQSLTILGTVNATAYSIAIGKKSNCANAGSPSGNSIAIGYKATTDVGYSLAVGCEATAHSQSSTALGCYAEAGDTSYSSEMGAIAIGISAQATRGYSIALKGKAKAIGAIQIGSGTNSTAGTLQIGITTDGSTFTQYQLLSSDGTIPADRLANAVLRFNTMPTADATHEGKIVQFTGTTDSTYTNGYFYKCVESGGVYSWGQVDTQPATGGALPSQTGHSGKFLTTDGSAASWVANSGVVDYQAPTSQNNYTWYRKYADGWVEQGGLLNDTGATGGTVNLPVAMDSAYYNVFVQTYSNGDKPVLYSNRTTTTFDYSGNVGKDSWMVCGVAASI